LWISLGGSSSKKKGRHMTHDSEFKLQWTQRWSDGVESIITMLLKSKNLDEAETEATAAWKNQLRCRDSDDNFHSPKLLAGDMVCPEIMLN
jgi:hypothetical protein